MRAVAATLFAAAVLALPAVAQEPTIVVGETSEQDAFLATPDGWPLYMFTADTRATDQAQAMSDCYEACAEAWPPLVVEDEPTAGPGLDPALLGTFERQDGSRQVTYAGWPLYRYFRDQRPAYDTHGQALDALGGVWYLLAPDGEIIEERRY